MGVTAMIVQVEGSEIRLSICQTRRILKGTVYCGEETYELNGKERTYKSYRPLCKHVPKPGCEGDCSPSDLKTNRARLPASSTQPGRSFGSYMSPQATARDVTSARRSAQPPSTFLCLPV